MISYQRDNGRLLAGIIEGHCLLVGNAHEQCKGLVTRRRVTKDTIEESTIDFVLMSADMDNEIVKTPTPTQHNTTVGFDTKMTVHTPPTTHHPQKLFRHF